MLKYKGPVATKAKFAFECANQAQKDLQDAIYTQDMALAVGSAGTGKTHAAVALALTYYKAKRIHKIVISRPSVGAGESNGYLPGTLEEKLAPYMRPIIDCFGKLTMGGMTSDLELCTFQHMRGRTFDDAFVILDEAQNASLGQIEMAVTRLGKDSKMIITADPTQCDLPPGRSGLDIFLEIVQDDLPEIGIVRFSESQNLRHPLVAQLTRSFAKRKAALKTAA